MDFASLYSDIAKTIRASEIRELLKLTQQPDVISFAGGLPNPKSFPVSDIKEIINNLLDERGSDILQYGTTEGVKELKRALIERMERVHGIKADMDNILITHGSQQGLYLLGKVFLNLKDIVIVEAPTYLGALNAFQTYFPRYISVPLDDEGMRTDLLEEKLRFLVKEKLKPKFIYTVPTFHNPAGTCMPLDRRKHLLEIVEELDMFIVEDDPYGELRFSGEKVPHLKALDRNDRVLYFSTFSKILAPGFRIAFAVGPKEVIRKFALAKQGVDLCTNPFGQYVAAEYVKKGYLDRHLKNIIAMYKEKRDIMLDAMDEYFPKEAMWTRPDGGMFLWVTLPKTVNTEKMFPKAIEKKVAYVHGAAFYPDRSGTNTMRLNFTHPSNDKIPEGVKRLSEVIREELGK